MGEALASLAVAGAGRVGTDDNPHRSPYVNQRVAVELKNVSPPFAGGRVVTRALVDLRRNDLDNAKVLLGGGNGLRGSAPEALTGRSYLLVNNEYRTRA